MSSLFIVSTPIGNLDDITIRALKTLFSVDYIACEDTRKTGQMLKEYESRITNNELRIKNLDLKGKPKLISFYDEVEEQKTQEIISILENGHDVALVSDSGTPLIADPGYKLAHACLKNKIKVVSVPGASSLLASLSSSALPSNRFIFLGYLPPKQKKRKKLINSVVTGIKAMNQKDMTVIFFESPHRLTETLKDMQEILGNKEIVICRELTKIHEEIWRGKVTDALDHFPQPKGEFVVLWCVNY